MPLRWTPDRCPVLVQFGTGQVLLLILRSTNTEPRAVATGQTLAFRLLLAIGYYKHNCLPIALSVRPGRYRSRFRICVMLLLLISRSWRCRFANTKLNHYPERGGF